MKCFFITNGSLWYVVIIYVDISRHKTKSGKVYERVLLRTSYRDKETGKLIRQCLT